MKKVTLLGDSIRQIGYGTKVPELLGEEYEVNPEEFATKGRATPFAGHKVYGKCLLNVCGGKEVYKAE